ATGRGAAATPAPLAADARRLVAFLCRRRFRLEGAAGPQERLAVKNAKAPGELVTDVVHGQEHFTAGHLKRSEPDRLALPQRLVGQFANQPAVPLGLLKGACPQ